MALHYNLAKAYEMGEHDSFFVVNLIKMFCADISHDLKLLKATIDVKNYPDAVAFANKIKPTLEMLGMSVAAEEVAIIEKWAICEGKRKEIIETYTSLKERISKAVKEMNKNILLDASYK